jgi:hypothetical protein
MRKPKVWLMLLFLALTALSAQAGSDVGAVRDRLDQTIAAAVQGGLASPTDDATFLRRVWIDLAGHVPPATVARAFLDDGDPEKRAKMVASLLGSEEFADHWGRVLAMWATSERPISRDAYDGRVLHTYLRESILKKTPYDQVVRELLTGSGPNDASGPVNFLLRYDADPPRLAGAVGKNLLGVTIQCAQCHDHPFGRWKQEDFWGLAATFARVRKMESGAGDDLMAVVEARRGELTRPDPDAAREPEKKPADPNNPNEPPKQIVVKPRLLNGKSVPDGGRRAALANWVVARDNPLFARNLVNRTWEQFFGTALVPNLDKPDSTGSSAGVLALLSEDFGANGHDLRRLLHIIVLSKAYNQASSSRSNPVWAKPAPRPMSVDQLHASIAQATGYDGPPIGEGEAEPNVKAVDEEAEDAHAEADIGTSRPEENAAAPEDTNEDDSDRPAEALGERALTMQRALVLLNGDFVREASRSAVRVARASLGRQTEDARIDWACLATLTRRPTAKERTILRGLLVEVNGLEDIYWVLINSAEFQGIH